jgi:hypothetical protein
VSKGAVVELGKIYKNISVNEFHIKRDESGFLVSFTFNHIEGTISVKLTGVRDCAGIIELLEADRIWVEKTDGAQLEFGRLTLGISHEYYTEVAFDTFAS